MGKEKRNYKIRYRIEKWDKPRPEGLKKISAGILVSDDDNGYSDDIFIASIMHNEEGEIGSILLLDSGGVPSREMLLAIRSQIDHQLEHHT